MNRAEKITGTIVAVVLANLPVCGALLGFGPLMGAGLAFALWLCFIAINVLPLWQKDCFTRLGMMLGGEILTEINTVACTVNFCLYLYWVLNMGRLGISLPQLLIGIVYAVLIGLILCVNGVTRMLVTSVQLGIRGRVLLLLCWWIPLLNLFLLWRTCHAVRQEYLFETEKKELDTVRRENTLCATRYPLVLVHGVFFRDQRFFNYWGRVPAELIRNGARVWYGNQQSAASVASCAEELKARVEEIVRETGCEKVNLIAHSKGGLDSRWAISRLGLAPLVASLTTINRTAAAPLLTGCSASVRLRSARLLPKATMPRCIVLGIQIPILWTLCRI